MRRHSRVHHHRIRLNNGALRMPNKALRRVLWYLITFSSSMSMSPATVVACGEGELAGAAEFVGQLRRRIMLCHILDSGLLMSSTSSTRCTCS
jgi:hypothetical protein